MTTKSDPVIKRIIGAALVLAVPFVLWRFNPNIENSESICPFMRLLGIPCPGCGLTKSIICIFSARWADSLTYHPFGIIIAGMAVLLIILSCYDMRHGTYLSDRLLNNSLLWKILPCIFLIFYTTRLFFTFRYKV